jgi:hypothetical protein
MLGEQASLRFRQPISALARFEVGEDRFVRIRESAQTSGSTPAVHGVNVVLLGPELAGRIAANEAAALNLADSLSMRRRCR